jgi:DNA-directed RNA polymerase specialized sigma24 family protein
MATVTSGIFLAAHQRVPSTNRKEGDTLNQRFSRWRKTLHLIACRILADSEMAACAVENCHLKASRNPPLFETDGAFGSWVLRLLIGEALSILHPNHAEEFENTKPCPTFATDKTIDGQ